jgi:recombination protein RecA
LTACATIQEIQTDPRRLNTFMSARANALRLQVETALAGRVASPFEYRDRQVVETAPAGVPEIDRLTGGLPRGGLTEICGPPASGRTSVLVAAMAARTEAAEVCALVDARDAFDPQSAAEAGVRLGQLLWVRCRNVDQALRATDLLIQGGGFGLIALDLGDTPARVARAIPLPVWFRMRRAVEHTPTILVALELESNAKTCASLVLRMGAREARWTQTSEAIYGEELEGKSPPSKTEGGAPGDEDFEQKAPRSENEHGAPGKALRKAPGEARILTLGNRTFIARGTLFLPQAQGCLFEGATHFAEMVRSRAKREGDRMAWREEKAEGAKFETSAT